VRNPECERRPAFHSTAALYYSRHSPWAASDVQKVFFRNARRIARNDRRPHLILLAMEDITRSLAKAK
jgi:hypothetical protein